MPPGEKSAQYSLRWVKRCQIQVFKGLSEVKKLLFVDDEPHFLAAIQRLLRKHKNEWQVFFAESVREALQLVAENNFDVILSDFNMPGRTGFDLLADLQVNRSTRAIPVIILTGSAEKNIKHQALENGATDLLSKPVEYTDLIARITSAIRLKSYQDEVIQHNLTLEKRVQERTKELEFLRLDLIWRLAKAGEMRDEDTGDHVIRVARYSRQVAIAIGLSKKETDLILFTSPLHDLGKIGIPDGILQKEGKLDADEWSIMNQHCQLGASILLEKPKGMRLLEEENQFAPALFAIDDELRTTAATIALSHHEKWDGSGYPHGLSGTDIPLLGRIVAYADVYDALRSKRPYKKELSRKDAWSIIEQGVGKHFDPDIFEKIKDMQDTFERIRDLH